MGIGRWFCTCIQCIVITSKQWLVSFLLLLLYVWHLQVGLFLSVLIFIQFLRITTTPLCCLNVSCLNGRPPFPAPLQIASHAASRDHCPPLCEISCVSFHLWKRTRGICFSVPGLFRLTQYSPVLPALPQTAQGSVLFVAELCSEYKRHFVYLLTISQHLSWTLFWITTVCCKHTRCSSFLGTLTSFLLDIHPGVG